MSVEYSEEYEKILEVLKSFDPAISVKIYEKESGIPMGSGNVIFVRIDKIDYESLSIRSDLYKVIVKGSIEAIIDNISKFNALKNYLVKKMSQHSGVEEVFVPNGVEQLVLQTGHYLTLNFTFYYIKRVV